MSPTPSWEWLSLIAVVALVLGLGSFLFILADQRRRPTPAMKIMLWVWPINALWSGPLGIWAYRALGPGRAAPLPEHHGHSPLDGPPEHPPHGPMPGHRPSSPPDAEAGMHGMDHSGMPAMHGMDHSGMPAMHGMDHSGMPAMHGDSPSRPFRQKVTVGTLHCGAGCTLADLIGPWLFRAMPFSLAGSPIYGEWALEYVLALIFGVVFQYAGLAAMVPERGPALWWRAFKVDFFSLTAWQVGMYAWMAVSMFGLFGPLSPTTPLFWFMMQIAMACGFLTSYPMNWLLIRTGIKKAM